LYRYCRFRQHGLKRRAPTAVGQALPPDRGRGYQTKRPGVPYLRITKKDGWVPHPIESLGGDRVGAGLHEDHAIISRQRG